MTSFWNQTNFKFHEDKKQTKTIFVETENIAVAERIALTLHCVQSADRPRVQSKSSSLEFLFFISRQICDDSQFTLDAIGFRQSLAFVHPGSLMPKCIYRAIIVEIRFISLISSRDSEFSSLKAIVNCLSEDDVWSLFRNFSTSSHHTCNLISVALIFSLIYGDVIINYYIQIAFVCI